MHATRTGIKANPTKVNEVEIVPKSVLQNICTPPRRDNTKNATLNPPPIAFISPRVRDPAGGTQATKKFSTAASTQPNFKKAHKDILPTEGAASGAHIPNNTLLTQKRKRREESPASSDSSLPDLEVLLSANPETQKRIDRIAKKKFNHTSNRTLPDRSMQTKRLLSQKDTKSLLYIRDKDEREKREQKLIRQQLAAEKVKVMWMEGEITKWKELVRRIKMGNDGDHNSWNSPQGAFEQLCGEVMGWTASRDGDDSDED